MNVNIKKIKKVSPGDIVNQTGSSSLGIHNSKAFLAGILSELSGHRFIMSKTNRYIASIDDLVIGKVVYTSLDFYRVDLGTCTGILPSLSFNNASKRNKPEINKNDYVFCKVVQTNVEPLLSCQSNGLGKINGYIVYLECWKVRYCYTHSILGDIGKKYKYRIALGMNGMIWIDSENAIEARDIYNHLTAIQ